MSGEGVLLDSVILIDHFNGVEAATEFLRSCNGSAAISAITRAEVLSGFRPSSAVLAKALLDRFSFLPIELRVADLAAVYRQEYRWKLPDAIQAACAQIHGLRLATRNTKDFPPKRHPFVLVPYRL